MFLFKLTSNKIIFDKIDFYYQRIDSASFNPQAFCFFNTFKLGYNYHGYDKFKAITKKIKL